METNAMVHKIAQCYTEHFDGVPQLYFSPGRINLIGEHVDYNDGFVMPAAIDKGAYFAVAANGTNHIHLYSLDFEDACNVPLDAVHKTKGWPNYLLSVVNEFLLLGLPVQGFNAALVATVPRGSGLSSSAAVEGGLAYALNDIFGFALDRVALAQLCQRAEHNFPGVQCGIMDQFANLMGKKDHVVLLDCRSMAYAYYPLQLEGYAIVLLNSGVHHSLASSQYNLRRQQCETGLAAMGLASFREVKDLETLQTYRSQMDALIFQRCQYVVAEIGRTQQAAQYLHQGDLAAFGALMYATHEGLSQLYEVSCAELDFLVAQAQQNPAVLGARMMGGGFGGCTINLVKAGAVVEFVTSTSDAYEQAFAQKPAVYAVTLADGVTRIAL
jgi:galactokinase